MMVKQELATAEGAASLYERALKVINSQENSIILFLNPSLYFSGSIRYSFNFNFLFFIYFPLHLLYLRSQHSSFPNKGDALVDAAIEAYAADRDVTEFLDTLQILSSHTPEGDFS